MGDCLVFTLQAEMDSACCTSEQNKNIEQEIMQWGTFYPSGFDWTGKSETCWAMILLVYIMFVLYKSLG